MLITGFPLLLFACRRCTRSLHSCYRAS